MSTIDNLNFKLILDDKEFNEQIKQAEENAKKLNMSVSKYISLRDKMAASNAKQVVAEEKAAAAKLKTATAQERLNEASAKAATAQKKTQIAEEQLSAAHSRAAAAQERLNRLMERGNRTISNQSRLLGELKNMATAAFSVYAAKEVVTNLVRVSAEFEAQRTALGAILGDVAQAQNLFSDIKELAVVSPFSVRDLTAYTKQLSAFSVPYEELFETTKMLADVSAGLGVDMGRIILAYGQVRSAAFLRGTEVRQFTEAGIPILDRLAEMFTEIEGRAVSVGEVFDKISFRQVPFEMVQQAFEDMTSEGGQFYNMQLVLSETLQGQLSNLRDAYEIMFSEIGEKTDGVLKKAVGFARSLAENYEEVGKTILQLISIYGAYKVAVAALNFADAVRYQMTLARWAGETAVAYKGLTQAIKNTTIAQKVLNLVAKVNPYAAVFSALALVVGLVWRYHDSLAGLSKMQQSVKKSTEDLQESTDAELLKLEALYSRYELAKEGTEEYKEAKQALFSQYRTYISELEAEGVAISNNTALYEALRKKIIDTEREKARSAAFQDLEESYSGKIGELMSGGGQYTFERLAKELEASASEREALRALVLGQISMEELEAMEEYASLMDKINNGYVSLGPGSSGPVKATEYIDQLSGALANAADEYAQSTAELKEVFDVLDKKSKSTAEDMRAEWVKTAQAILGTKESFRSIWPDEESEYKGYLDTLKKRYAEILEQISLAGNVQAGQLPILREELRMIGQIARAYDSGTGNTNIYDYVTGVKDTASGSGLSDADKARRDELRKQIEDLLILKEAYDELAEAMIAAGKTPVPEDILAKLRETYGGSMDESAFVDTEFLERALVLIEKIREYDADLADSFLQRLGEDDWSKLVKYFEDLAAAIDKAKKAQEDFEKYMKSWTSEAELSGEGPAFEISKIVSDYTKALEDAQSKMDEAYDKLAERSAANSAAGKGMPIWAFLSDVEQIKGNYGNDVDNAQVEALSNVREFAKDYVEAWGPLQKFDLSNWKDLTIRELNEILDIIENFDVSQLPENILKQLNKIPGGVAAFIKWLKENFGEIKEKAENTKIEKLYENYSKIASGISELAGSVQEFAEASGDDGLASAMEGLQSILSITDDVFSRLAQGDTAGAIIAAFTGIVQECMEAATQAAKLEAAIADAAAEARILRMQMRLDEGVDTIFGEDELMRLRNARDVLDELRASVANDRNYADSDISWKSGLFGWGRSSDSLRNIMNELGYDLYDEYGNLNADGLQAILDTYEDLTSADREWIESAISNSQMYEEAMLQIRDTLSGMFGQLASDLTSGMIDAWKTTGDVVNGIDGAFQNLGENIISYMLQSMLIENVLNKYQDRINEIASAYGGGDIGREEMLNQTAALMQGVRADVEAMADVSNALLEQGAELGMIASDGEGSLGESIMSANLTEETGSLIASYINAIRADVSFSKSQRAQLIDMSGQILNSMMPTPKLDEYLQAIQANTLNAANAARDILSELRGVITSEGGASAFRTYM